MIRSLSLPFQELQHAGSHPQMLGSGLFICAKMQSGRMVKMSPRRTLFDRGSEPFVTDGPFVEGKEVVSGYTEVEVNDLDEVLRMVRTWPGCPIVEIRPLEG